MHYSALCTYIGYHLAFYAPLVTVVVVAAATGGQEKSINNDTLDYMYSILVGPVGQIMGLFAAVCWIFFYSNKQRQVLKLILVLVSQSYLGVLFRFFYFKRADFAIAYFAGLLPTLAVMIILIFILDECRKRKILMSLGLFVYTGGFAAETFIKVFATRCIIYSTPTLSGICVGIALMEAGCILGYLATKRQAQEGIMLKVDV
jgi:hypothetical protein